MQQSRLSTTINCSSEFNQPFISIKWVTHSYLTRCSYNIVTKTKAGVSSDTSWFCTSLGTKPRIMHQEALWVVTCNSKQPKLCGMPPNDVVKCVAYSVTTRSCWIQISAPHAAFLNDVWRFLAQFFHANVRIVAQITLLTVPVTFLHGVHRYYFIDLYGRP
jgi:hypothetical protein